MGGIADGLVEQRGTLFTDEIVGEAETADETAGDEHAHGTAAAETGDVGGRRECSRAARRDRTHVIDGRGLGGRGDVPHGLLHLSPRLLGRAFVVLEDGRVEHARHDRQSIGRQMWGLPGVMVACLDAHGPTGQAQWLELFQAAAAWLIGELRGSERGRSACRISTAARRPGSGRCTATPATSPCCCAAGRSWTRGDAGRWRRPCERCYPPPPGVDPQGVTWPAVAGQKAPARLVQHCHGAPGMVSALAAGPVRSPELDRLLLDAGELTWQAGPLAKGGTLCHGTGGNGYAFSRLWRHVGEALWLDRARAFAMAAIAQSRWTRRELGRGRFTLWTGDPGLAVYLWACMEGEVGFPAVDPWRTRCWRTRWGFGPHAVSGAGAVGPAGAGRARVRALATSAVLVQAVQRRPP